MNMKNVSLWTMAGVLLLAMQPLRAQTGAGPDELKLLQAENRMLREELRRRNAEIDSLKQQLAELQARLSESPAGDHSAGAASQPTDAATARASVAIAKTPAEAQFKSVSGMLNKIPVELTPPGAATTEQLDALAQWADTELAGKSLYTTFKLQKRIVGADNTVILSGPAPLQMTFRGRTAMITLVVVLPAATAPPEGAIAPNAIVKVVGMLADNAPLSAGQGKVTTVQEVTAMGKAVQHQSTTADVNGWNEKAILLTIRLNHCTIVP
jgi:hypothetical protein